MHGLPPQEIAALNTAHLAAPQPLWRTRVDAFLSSATQVNSPQVRPWIALAVVSVLPLGLLFWAQPVTPQLRAHNQQLVSSYLAQQQRSGQFVASAQTENTESFNEGESPEPSSAPIAANLVAADSVPINTVSGSDNTLLSTEEKAYRYHLTLAQGFMQKAVQVSQSTARTQTPADQEAIMQYLDQALASVNQAIDLDPANGLGFLLRARIYKTASAIDPTLTAKADQDIVIAQALGVQNSDILTQEVIDQLPTQQAQLLAGGPVIADAEEGTNTSVQTTASDNAQQGEVVLAAGEIEVFVELPALTDSMTISVKISPNSSFRPNTPLRVASRKSGEGFSIQSFNPLEENVTLFWRIVE